MNVRRGCTPRARRVAPKSVRNTWTPWSNSSASRNFLESNPSLARTNGDQPHEATPDIAPCRSWQSVPFYDGARSIRACCSRAPQHPCPAYGRTAPVPRQATGSLPPSTAAATSLIPTNVSTESTSSKLDVVRLGAPLSVASSTGSALPVPSTSQDSAPVSVS